MRVSLVRAGRSSRWLAFGLGVGLALGAPACGPGEDSPDGGDGFDGGLDRCVIDNSQRRSTADEAWKLEPGGEAKTGFICPQGDIDHYWFTISRPGTILSVHLSNSVPMSPVDLCYSLFPEADGAPAVGGLCDSDGMDGQTDLRGTHYLVAAGTYFLEVRDEGSNEEDPRNPYRLEIDEIPDPDTYEPNNDMATAKPLVPGRPGYISFLGDRDWYRIDTTQPGQIVRIGLTTAGPGPVDLKYVLLRPDGQTPVNGGLNPDGMRGATSLSDLLPVPEVGTYYLVVSDDRDDDSSIEVGYQLTLSLELDPDTRDRNPRNDGFGSAVGIMSGSPVTQAYLATRADEDWYRIEAAGVSDTQPAILEIELVMDSASPVDPAVDLILGDPRTPCQAGDACDVLTASCGGSCDTAECRNAQCPSHECLTHLGRCRGAGFCLPEGGCAIRHLVVQGADWSPTGNPRHLRTVAPMYGPVYYVLVRDFQANAWDPERAYTLTVTVRPEPDAHEPNGVFLPYATNEQEEAARSANPPRATPVSCSDDGTTVTCGPITGYLSYRGDQDWYRLDSIPSEDEPLPEALSVKVDWDVQMDWTFAGNSALQVYYTMFLGGARSMRTGFCATPGGSSHEGGCYRNTTGGTMGADVCSYICGEYHGGRPAYLRVMHYDRKLWDYAAPYTLTVRAIRGCPQVCEWCRPETVNYACPNPGNPNPGG